MMMRVRTFLCLLLARVAAADGTGAHQCSAGAFDCAFDTLEFVQTKLHIRTSETRGRPRQADVDLKEPVYFKPEGSAGAAVGEARRPTLREVLGWLHRFMKPEGSAGAAAGDARRPTLREVMGWLHRVMWVPPSKYLLTALGGETPLPRSFVARRSAPKTSCNTVLQKMLVEPYKYCFFPVMLMMAALILPFLLQEAGRAHPWQVAPAKGKLLSIGD